MMQLEAWQRAIDVAASRDTRWRSPAWTGRWIVVERAYPNRGRRFTSLSRARGFAREASGVVRRFRAQMWRPLDHWKYVHDMSRAILGAIDLAAVLDDA